MATLLVFLLSITAYADDSATPDELQDEQLIPFEAVGMNLPWPEELNGKEGLLGASQLGAIDFGHHVYGMAFSYTALPKDEAFDMVNSDELSEEEQEELYLTENLLVMLLATDQDLDTIQRKYEEAVGTDIPLDFILGYPLDFNNAEEIGWADGYTFYAVPGICADYLTRIDDKFAEEYQKLQQLWIETAKSGVFYAPVDQTRDEPANKLQFTTTDLEGNTVTSEELFSGNEITMVNCWGIWCSNCMDEMEELARMHTRMQEKGCGIVGLEWEKDEAMYNEAIQTLQSYGVSYPNALMPDEMVEKVWGYPATFFVDKEGTVLCNPIIGARIDVYEKILDELLSLRNDASETTKEAAFLEITDSITAVYEVHVTDDIGPVEGVMIQFCDDATCRIQETDDDGRASFEAPAGKEYEVHILKVPETYQEDDEVYIISADSTEMNIHLQ